MKQRKRATAYFDALAHQALPLKAATTDRSISDMVNDAVKVALAEDAEDLAAFGPHDSERSVSFESLVRDPRKSGRPWVADQTVGREGRRGGRNQTGPTTNRRTDPIVGDRAQAAGQ
jgi:hypothetical protein